MLARICTENKDYNGILAKVMLYFKGATIIKADGLWQGTIEHSLIIEILDADKQDVEKLAYDIKKMNRQQAVLIQYVQCESKMI